MVRQEEKLEYGDIEMGPACSRSMPLKPSEGLFAQYMLGDPKLHQ